MSIEYLQLPDWLEKGEPARLIPTGAESSKEARAVSALMAAIMSVEEYGRQMLAMVDAPTSKRARFYGYTEVVFPGEPSLRPDGLIRIVNGANEWTALIEAKVGNNELSKEQIESYLGLARQNGIDAVITVSNQFATIPSHHPVQVNGNKTRSVSLYHWSWSALMSEAILLTNRKGVSDPEQAYILQELIRFLRHPNSGVSGFNRMSSSWKDICQQARNESAIRRNDDRAGDIIRDWRQLERFLALELSIAIGRSVGVYLPRAHKNDPTVRFADALETLTNSYLLETELVIPDAPNRLYVYADLGRRTLGASMTVKAPQDKSRSTASVTWIKKQLEVCEDDNIIVKAHFPGRTTALDAPLSHIRDDQKSICHDSLSMLPNYFEALKIQDNGNRFIGAKTFIDEARSLTLSFYRDAAQHMRSWVPPTPKMEEPVTQPAAQLETGVGGAPSPEIATDGSQAGLSRFPLRFLFN